MIKCQMICTECIRNLEKGAHSVWSAKESQSDWDDMPPRAGALAKGQSKLHMGERLGPSEGREGMYLGGGNKLGIKYQGHMDSECHTKMFGF